MIAGFLIGSVMAKVASQYIEEARMYKELDQWANYFFKVTNNFYVYYKNVNDKILDYFETG